MIEIGNGIPNENDIENGKTLLMEPDWLANLFNHMEKRIVKDEMVKRILFKSLISRFCMLEPLNVLMREEWSTGKSFLAKSVAKYIPPQYVSILEGMTPKSLYYEYGVRDEEKQTTTINLNNRILVFTDLAHVEDLTMLRSMMSHDSYKREYKTVSDHKKPMKIIMEGYAMVVACSADVKYDRELGSRCIALSPEKDQEKYKAVIRHKAKNLGDPGSWSMIDMLPYRGAIQYLISRGKQVQFSYAEEWIEELIQSMDLGRDPADMRFGDHLPKLAMATAWLNQQHGGRIDQDKHGHNNVEVLREDWDKVLEEAKPILKLTMTGLTPSQLKFLEEALSPLEGQTISELIIAHHRLFRRPIGVRTIRSRYLQPLEGAGYVYSETDPMDKRRKIYKRITYDEKEAEEVEAKQKELESKQGLNKFVEEVEE